VVSWSVSDLLEFIATWHPASSLSLRQLTLKTLALIAVSSSDRGQTIHAMDIENTHVTREGIEFVIFDALKTSHLKRKPKIVKCISSKNGSLDVCKYVLDYMNRTLPLRAACVKRGLPKPTKLFLSWKTKMPVAQNTISRWLKLILKIAGINTEMFSGHSFRGSSLSAAYSSGVSTSQILKAGDWCNVNTFLNYYNNPEEDSPVGRIILNKLKVW